VAKKKRRVYVIKKGERIDWFSRKGKAVIEGGIPHLTLGQDKSNEWTLSMHWRYRGKNVWLNITTGNKYPKALSLALMYAKHYNLPLIKFVELTTFKVLWTSGEDLPEYKTRRKFFFLDLNVEIKKKWAEAKKIKSKRKFKKK
jgi:hypothetical protein